MSFEAFQALTVTAQHARKFGESIPGFCGKETAVLRAARLQSGWRLIQPLFLTVEIDETGDYIVSDSLFAVYGEKKTLSKATRDYLDSLVEYATLVQLGCSTHPGNRDILRKPQQYLRPPSMHMAPQWLGSEKQLKAGSPVSLDLPKSRLVAAETTCGTSYSWTDVLPPFKQEAHTPRRKTLAAL